MKKQDERGLDQVESNVVAESNERAVVLHGSVWMTIEGENFGGSGRIALLAKIAECGSITQAAKAFKMSYKAAWDAIDSMNKLTDEPLVERLSGGKGGGGTRLTPRGERLVENFRIIEQEHRRFLDQLSHQAEGVTDDLFILRRMSMKTSARNQLFGKVVQVKIGAVNDEIVLEVAGGERIVATVTQESTKDLGLRVGAEVFALIKSSSVIIAGHSPDMKVSARNRLSGTITQVQTGSINSEVVIELAGGQSIVSVVTNESAVSLDLVVGAKVIGIFKASSVILGIPV